MTARLCSCNCGSVLSKHNGRDYIKGHNPHYKRKQGLCWACLKKVEVKEVPPAPLNAPERKETPFYCKPDCQCYICAPLKAMQAAARKNFTTYQTLNWR